MSVSPERLHALLAVMIAFSQKASVALVADLESAFGPIESWWRARHSTLGATPKWSMLRARELDHQAEATHHALIKCRFDAIETALVPELRSLPDPTPLLFVRGTAAWSQPAVAIVGARRASAYGLRVTRNMAEGLALARVPVLSGLARGIDAAAHRATLAAGGITFAFLGSGPDRPYPAEHRGLMEEIAASGLIVTEFLPGTPPLPHHFPRRNRILAAAASAVLLVESRLRSGSLSTVKWGADLGREVLVVPGPVDHELGEGPLQLLKEGATPVGSVADVLASIGMTQLTDSVTSQNTIVLSLEETSLITLCGGEGVDLDILIASMESDPASVLGVILDLEGRGILERMEDGRSFRRKNSAATRAGRVP